ncbi:MAG: 3-phosphoshikimate 1-carboxyvinyltransferase [Paludibacteraceae bacterium]|nr:3-phosphoshikimate 1-carboxyvinyltransferase [Paludibacteraceae bacterium]
MKNLILQRPIRVAGTVALPASKSISNRVLVIDRLAGGDGSLLTHVADCDDTRAVLSALSDTTGVKNIGAAGTAMRFLTAYYALQPGAATLTGSERMCHRPIAVLVDALRQMGGRIGYAGTDGFPPLRIEGGGLQGGEVRMDGSVSSQYVSALLMVGPCLPGGLTIRFEGAVASRPYIDMTLALMRQFGAQADWTTEGALRVHPGGYRPRTFAVESDWSAASYWYEVMAVSNDPDARLELPGLCEGSLQGDSRVAEWFEPLGVCTAFTGEGVVLTRGRRSARSLALDFSRQPDLAQTMVTTCCILGIPFHFTGLQSLKIKETDRIAALTTECAKLGCVLTEPADGQLRYDGRRQAHGHPASIATYEDHRMAMAFAPFALYEEALQIEHPEVVSKSYPGFWQDWENCLILHQR